MAREWFTDTGVNERHLAAALANIVVVVEATANNSVNRSGTSGQLCTLSLGVGIPCDDLVQAIETFGPALHMQSQARLVEKWSLIDG